jgi:thioredoxin 2
MLRTCRACGAQNRVPAKFLATKGKCGSCKTALPPVDSPIDVDAGAFDELVAEAKVPVLVDFWASWCAPCKMAAPEVQKVALEEAGGALVLKVDTDRYPELAARYGVQGIPSFVVFNKGTKVFQQAGLVRASDMSGWLHKAKPKL